MQKLDHKIGRTDEKSRALQALASEEMNADNELVYHMQNQSVAKNVSDQLNNVEESSGRQYEQVTGHSAALGHRVSPRHAQVAFGSGQR